MFRQPMAFMKQVMQKSNVARIAAWFSVMIWTLYIVGQPIVRALAGFNFLHVDQIRYKGYCIQAFIATVLLLSFGGTLYMTIKNRAVPFLSKNFLLISSFWLLLAIRLIYQGLTHENARPTGDFTDVIRVLFILGMNIFAILFASYGIDDKINKHIWQTAIVLLALFNIFLVIRWCNYIAVGATIKSPLFKSGFLSEKGGIEADAFSILGCMLASLILWAWVEKKINFTKFAVLYACGIILLNFAMQRHCFVALIFANFVILIAGLLRKRNKLWLVILFVIAINGACLTYVGMGTSARLSKGFDTLFKDLHAVSKTKTNIFIPPPPEFAQNDPADNPPFQDEFQTSEISKADEDGLRQMSANTHVSEVRPKVEDAAEMAKQREAERKKIRRTGSFRLMLWFDSIQKICENPILGYGQSPYRYDDENIPHDVPQRFRGVDPHNGFIAAFLMTGIVGGTLFLLLVGCAVVDAVKCWRYHPDFSWLVVVFAISLVEISLSAALTSKLAFWVSIVGLRALIAYGSPIPENSETLVNE